MAPPERARAHARRQALSGALLHVHGRLRKVRLRAHHHHGRLVRADEGDHRPVGSPDLRAPRALVPCSCRGLRPPLPRGGVVGHLRPATRPPAPSVAVAATEETTFFVTVLLWLYDEFAGRVFKGWEPLLLTSPSWVVHAWYRTGGWPSRSASAKTTIYTRQPCAGLLRGYTPGTDGRCITVTLRTSARQYRPREVYWTAVGTCLSPDTGVY